MSTELRSQLESAFRGQYSIVGELSGGGMARVFVAMDTALGRRIVIKVLSPQLAVGRSAKRFEREIRLAASLQHANIVPVLSAGERDGIPHYTMPFVEGRSLEEELERHGRPSLARTIGILRDIARALAYAHEHGVVHRDIKPGNVLLSGAAAVVTDFGIAKALDNALLDGVARAAKGSTVTQAGTAVGTPAYMAPEQIAGDPDIDHRADLYAFGCLAYELLAGTLPFGDRQVHALFLAHVSEAPAPLAARCPDCPSTLTRVVMQCLEKNPARRPQSAQEILDVIDPPTRAESPFARFRALLTRRRAMAAVILVSACVSAAVFIARRGVPKEPHRIQSLAVLPLENLSGDSTQGYLADGMHEALIMNLSKLSGLRRVIARTSVVRYRGTDKTPAQIARELGVEAIVTGSWSSSGGRARVTAHLIDGHDEQLWSEQYDRDLRDVLTLQNEIVTAITRQIRLTLTPDEERQLAHRRLVTSEGYEDYLKGRFYWYKLTPENLATAQQYFETALRKDPSYAAAHAGMSDVWAARGEPAKAKAAALRAIELDDRLAHGHDVLARLLAWYEWNWAAAEKEFVRAIELDPNYPDARAFYSMLLIGLGRSREGMAQVQKALELEPLNSLYQGFYAFELVATRRDEEAIVQARKTLAMADPANARLPHEILRLVYHKRGMLEAAVREAQQGYASDGHSQLGNELLRDFAKLGYAEAHRRAARRLAAQPALNSTDPEGDLAQLYAYAGEKDRALASLEKAFVTHSSLMVDLGVDPTWDDLRDEPRFRQLLRKLNLRPAR
jgi:serine/threonine-protein kinase